MYIAKVFSMLKGVLISNSVKLNAAIIDLLPRNIEFNTLTVNALNANQLALQHLVADINCVLIDFTYNDFYSQYCEIYKQVFKQTPIKIAIADFKVAKENLLESCEFTHVLSLSELSSLKTILKNTKNT